MRDEKKIREEVYLSIEEQLKAEIMNTDKELEKLEREKVRLMILKDLTLEGEISEGKIQTHKMHEDAIIEEIEKKQKKLKKEIDDKQMKITKLAKLKSKYIK